VSEIITATFRDGAFVPEQAPAVAPGARVKLTVETLDERVEANTPAGSAEALARFDALCEKLSVSRGKRLTRDELHDRS
jgi:hypothetical protein